MPDSIEAADVLRRRLGAEPFAALVVLGSGLGALVDAVEAPAAVGFEELPGLPRAGVLGHHGRWVAGGLEGRRVLVQAGRYHLYEGLGAELVCAPVRLAAALGVPVAVVTNAAGGVRPDLGPGTLVLLEDHLNLTGQTAPTGLAGTAPVSPAPREPYDRELRELASRCAAELGVALPAGVYAGVCGPSYETPAEIRMLAQLGADLVGMSTVLEVGAAGALGLRCLGLSLVTNHAAGIAPAPLSHAEVIEVGERSAAAFERLIRAVVRRLP
jgi:purine-nucleoside phosphorylase